jgi:hypothetical protein
MTSLCVFCGSSPGANGAYTQAARAFGKLLAQHNITLVFGGGKVGLMGHVADAVLHHGGKAVGVIPEALVQKEVAHESLTTLHVVKDMHERKALMYNLADAFVAMPGGTGTLDEFFEVFTWTQLGLLLKPLGLLNVAGYFNHLAAFLRHTVAERFVTPEHLDTLVVEENPERLLQRLRTPSAVLPDKWIDRS